MITLQMNDRDSLYYPDAWKDAHLTGKWKIVTTEKGSDIYIEASCYFREEFVDQYNTRYVEKAKYKSIFHKLFRINPVIEKVPTTTRAIVCVKTPIHLSWIHEDDFRFIDVVEFNCNEGRL